MKPGTSSPQIAGLQKYLNSKFGYNVPTDGAYDDKTQAAVADMQGKMNMGYTSGIADAATMKALVEAAKPRKLVVIDGKEAWVTAEQLANLQKVAGKRAGDAVRQYVNLCNEAKGYWEVHEKTRGDNWFWSRAIETSTGADFPSKGLIDAAVRCAEAMERDARACNLKPEQLAARAAPIMAAFKAMSTYRSAMFDGGEDLIKALEIVRDSSVVVLQITAAVASGGASWQIQVGMSAGVAAYEAVLKEADKAAKEGSYSISSGVANVFIAAVVDGTVGLILKGGKLGPYLDDVAEAAIKQVGNKSLKVYAIKAANGAAQQFIEDGIKGIAGLMDPKKKLTYDDFVKGALESFIKGAGLKVISKTVEKYGSKAAKHFTIEDFKGISKNIDLDKAGEEGVKKTLEQFAPKVTEGVLAVWDAAKDPEKFEQELRKAILSDPRLKKAIESYAKKK